MLDFYPTHATHDSAVTIGATSGDVARMVISDRPYTNMRPGTVESRLRELSKPPNSSRIGFSNGNDETSANYADAIDASVGVPNVPSEEGVRLALDHAVLSGQRNQPLSASAAAGWTDSLTAHSTLHDIVRECRPDSDAARPRIDSSTGNSARTGPMGLHPRLVIGIAFERTKPNESGLRSSSQEIDSAIDDAERIGARPGVCARHRPA